MQPVKIHISETAGISRRAETVRLGVPFAKEWQPNLSDLTLLDTRSGTVLPCQFKPLSRWPNGALRWLAVTFTAPLEAKSSAQFLLQPGVGPNTAASTTTNSTQLCTVDTGKHNFTLDQNTLRWQSTAMTSHIELVDAQGNTCTSHIDGGWKTIDSGPVSTTLQARGHWSNGGDTPFAQFDCTLQFQRDLATAIVTLSIHNPRRARHNGGLWDLGDPGSIHFRSLKVTTLLPQAAAAELQPNTGGENISSEAGSTLRIYQNSSGGENWNSNNHVNASGVVTTRFCGYQISRNDEVISQGLRASPILRKGEIAVSLQHFWQQFPSALSATEEQITIELFPAEQDSIYELQAGERKQQTCYLDYAATQDSLLWTRAPLQPVLDASHYAAANAFPWFTANADNTALESLIQRGIDGPSNFFNKREVIDEYGWRNFGDLFADHETRNQPAGEPPLISHYNNQYDPIYGFARQFALSGDKRWFELMDDLARHVADIDIYHTTEDRGEYNNGLFWHTDHYLHAHTATHRTYTQHNTTSSVAGQTGGGPAAEHCYTTGLLYHYLMTGQETSRQAVLELAEWITANQEGSGGALEALLTLKKNELPQIKSLLKGKTLNTHRYPFTRGTGNYLNALLDAWQLSQNTRWLQQAETVIKATLHPGDDINQRELLNAELRWSYLVLLATIVKYLQIKIEAGQIDDSYHYARDALIHYTRWMVQHERPFLSVPDQLEFPNHTWVAQDIRKAMLMFQAARIDPEWSERYIAKGQEWLEYVTHTLRQSPEGHYTRILALMMLTHGPHQICPAERAFPAPSHPIRYQPPYLTWNLLTRRVAKRIITAIINFRPNRERAWLKARLN